MRFKLFTIKKETEVLDLFRMKQMTKGYIIVPKVSKQFSELIAKF